MLHSMPRLVFICVLGLCLSSGESMAWGQRGHRIIAEVAGELAGLRQEFWRNNALALGELSTVPDLDWKDDPNAYGERQAHWFHIDAYTVRPWVLPRYFQSYNETLKRFDANTLRENGTAYWRVPQLFELAVAALNRRDYVSVLQLAGVMSHYVGDLAQPLHVSVDYDGPGGGRNGIHSFFESDNLQSLDRETLKARVRDEAKRLLLVNIVQKQKSDSIYDIFDAGLARSAERIQTVFELDESYGRTAQGSEVLLDLAVERLADGALNLAAVLERLWQLGGDPAYAEAVNVPRPEWIPLQYRSGNQWDVALDTDCYGP